MSFNFPNTPSLGTVYTGPNGAQYVYDGVTWKQVVQAVAQVTALDDNIVINGSGLISQENSRNAVSANAAFHADQWQFAFAGTGFTPNGYSSANIAGRPCVFITNTVAKASLAAAEYLLQQQPIEGWRLGNLHWGLATAVPAVLNFKARASQAGTYSMVIRNAANDACFAYDFTLAAAASGWTEFTVPIPVPSVGTWDFLTDARGLILNFSHSAGSTYKTPAVGWNAGSSLFAGPGITNNTAVANNSLVITDVGLYADPFNTGVAPPYQMRSVQDDYNLCLRYFYNTLNNPFGQFLGTHMLGLGQTYSATLMDAMVHFPQLMRAVPTGSVSGTWNVTGAGGGTVAGTPGAVTVYSQKHAVVRFTGSGFISGGSAMAFTGDTTARCLFTARI